jgi:hypothetical protein
MSHRTPVLPGAHTQLQLDELLAVEHVDPMAQGEDEHTSGTGAQVAPENPLKHEQRNPPIDSVAHVPPFAHGLDKHGSSLDAQSTPVKSAGQRHEYTPTPRTHVAPLRQGDDAHRSVDVSHREPVNPRAQVHTNPETSMLATHEPPNRQGELIHSLGSRVWHCEPVQPEAQTHTKADIVDRHDPPFLHGLLAQKSTMLSHMTPVRPLGQAHVKPLGASKQLPPPKHGLLLHSFTSESH